MWICVSGIFNGVMIDVEKRFCVSIFICGSLKILCDCFWMNFMDVKCDWLCCCGDLCNVGYDVGYSFILFFVVVFLIVFFWFIIFKMLVVVINRLWLNSMCLFILGRFWMICIIGKCVRKIWEY